MATRKTAAKSTAKAAQPVEPVVVETAEPVIGAPDLSKKELIEKVVERAGVKKRDAKPAIEAALAILGEAVAEGRTLNLPGFGKLKINRAEEKANGRVTVCKLRQPKLQPKPEAKPEESAKEPLAEPAE